MPSTITDNILTANTLQQLCDAMNEAGDEINHIQQEGGDAGVLVGDYGRAVSDCPLFGGEAPDDAYGVWSWDADSLLVGEGWGGCEIVPRREW